MRRDACEILGSRNQSFAGAGHPFLFILLLAR
jgi:hypothetical protein